MPKSTTACSCDGLNDAFSGEHSGWHTEDLVTRMQITREAQDRWAERSQQRFSAAQAEGKFEAEIAPRPDQGTQGRRAISPGRGAAPGNDGRHSREIAACVPRRRQHHRRKRPRPQQRRIGDDRRIRAFAEANRIEPLARLVSYGVAAVEPGLFGLGPVPAVRQALERANWRLGDVERIEINEAFAAVPLAVLQELGLPEDIVNPEGGAIAHGHPIGATGAVLTTRLLHAMRRDGQRRGIVTLCIGGGQGIALALEAIT